MAKLPSNYNPENPDSARVCMELGLKTKNIGLVMLHSSIKNHRDNEMWDEPENDQPDF